MFAVANTKRTHTEKGGDGVMKDKSLKLWTFVAILAAVVFGRPAGLDACPQAPCNPNSGGCCFPGFCVDKGNCISYNGTQVCCS
jgi:hypothetical protein